MESNCCLTNKPSTHFKEFISFVWERDTQISNLISYLTNNQNGIYLQKTQLDLPQSAVTYTHLVLPLGI